MGSFPAGLVLPDNVITTSIGSLNSIGGGAGALGVFSGAIWPLADLAILVPFRLSSPCKAQVIAVINGGAASGNVDAGIYDCVGTKLVSAGSVAMSGTNAIQSFDVGDTLLGPGLFYMAFVVNNVTAQFIRWVPAVYFLEVVGCAQMASAFPLPAIATLATITNAYVPQMAVFGRALA